MNLKNRKKLVKKCNIKKFWKLLNILFTYILFILSSKFIKNNNIKVCICTIGKRENRYIREFIEYYQKLGVDKIYLYDNNDYDNEHFEDIIKDYIESKFVKIFNWRGIKKPHFKVIEDCYLRFNKYYDWFIFYDIDEYIHLYNYRNIKYFLSEKKFTKCKKIYLNWVLHTDNDLINYKNISLFKRFPEVESNAMIKKNFVQKGKTILRGNLTDFKIANSGGASHIITDSLETCNGFGKKINLTREHFMKNADAKYYYIDHFYTKSLEEFVDKINRGSAVNDKSEVYKLFRIIRYFNINKLKYSKYLYILKKSGLKLMNNI